MFSQKKFDYVRFDNYDEHWQVETKPHHFHLRNQGKVESSEMIGYPSIGIPLLVKFLKNLF
jgi:hypothetical protein